MPKTILVVEDDADLCELLEYNLSRSGYRVHIINRLDKALQELRNIQPDLVLLDVMLPDGDGFEFCRQVRADEALAGIPVLFLTARGEEVDRVLGLEIGGDDYITKPFSPRELVARVAAVLRRMTHEVERDERVVHGVLEVDLGRHECRYRGALLSFTVTELALLVALMRAPGRVIERDALVRKAYGDDHHITERTVDSHVRRIRAKLSAAGTDPIETVYGVGYRMRDTVS
jgi:two-component system OmpR family response regulator